METSLTERLSLRLANGWTAKELDGNRVVVYPVEEANRTPEELEKSIMFVMHENAKDMSAAVAKIMRRRARSVSPEADTEQYGIRLIRYDWTDGLADIESYFYDVGAGRILEVAYGIKVVFTEHEIRGHKDLVNQLRCGVDVQFAIQRLRQ